MSVGSVHELCNFSLRPFSQTSSFFPQKWLKVYKFSKLFGTSQFFNGILL